MARLRSLDDPHVVLFACLFASQSSMLVLSPTIVDVAREFGVSTATAGQLRSISGATGGLTALVLATVARRAGLRELLSALYGTREQLRSLHLRRDRDSRAHGDTEGITGRLGSSPGGVGEQLAGSIAVAISPS
jgi:hypothetical protein